MLYSIALSLYLILYNDIVSKTISIVLSSVAILATSLSDRSNIIQFVNAYHLVGLRKKSIAFILWLFFNVRIVILLIVYCIFAMNIIISLTFFITSNVAVALIIFQSVFKEVKL
ncbi:hypothetical protein QPL79_06860 [Ignisphaera sp. 4213-co]|uniref:Uncharacterized protein n=1 Tax=Ignisphaera cupida TaxID=3050454 RepID=A0ABD4Z9V5_9CREN|nr:hypothetical protein [Ignisphaera sp. 4213-co]MDK6029080.1 hypothetical protein [Ignisphaera sp. 4213-co]